MKTNAKFETVRQAIENVNRSKGYKLELNRAEQIGKYFHFTLKSPSKIPGARVSYSGRNLAKASWHAHGYVMDEIFNIEPAATIWSFGEKLTAGFFWKDREIGSYFRPMKFSQTSIL